MPIRKAKEKDLSRIAEIFICNNRINYFPIFKDESYSFGELQVVSFIDNYLKKDEVFKNLYIYDDGLIRGFIQMNGTEICKLSPLMFGFGIKVACRPWRFAIRLTAALNVCK